MLRLSHCVYLDLVSAPSKVPDLLSRSNISVVVTTTLITIIFAAWIKPENGTSPKFTEYKILGGGFLKIDFFEQAHMDLKYSNILMQLATTKKTYAQQKK